MFYRARDQFSRFVDADHARTRWILDTDCVLQHEQAIYASLQPDQGPVLELGVGEGLSLRLRPDLQRSDYIGSDLHPSRARAVRDQARALGVDAPALACDASRLPFRDGSVGTVLCRDLLHHLPLAARLAAIAEVARILRPGGRLSLIEPNAGRSLLVALFSALIRTERMALRFNADELRGWLKTAFTQVQIDHVEPSMLYRMLCHHRFGRPSLGKDRRWLWGLERWESLARRYAPPERWTYLRALAIK